MTRGRPILVLMLVAALSPALPASAALAQSAGDNQYQDPLGAGGGSSGSSGSGGGSTGSSKQSAPSRPAQSGGGNSAPATRSQAPRTVRSVPLARTGFDAWIPAVAGLVLLASGTLLLVRTRRRGSRTGLS